MTLSQLLQIFLFLGGSALVGAVFLFTHQMITRLSQEVETTSRVLAGFCAQASYPATSDPQLRQIFSQVIANLDFPIVITYRKNQPIGMTAGSGVPIGAVHYGDPPVLDRLRWMPLVSVAGVALLLAIGLWGLAIIRQSEHRSIWVGMAKETAHQLGTPLSSLLGWAELLRVHAEAVPPGGRVQIPAAELAETVAEMER